MEIIKNIKIIDLALYLDETLIIADLHIGYEEALNKQGVLIPRIGFKQLILRLEKILKKVVENKFSKTSKEVKPKKIIINGDIKHEFGKISKTEWRHTLRLLNFLEKHCKEVILIKGNHDKILGPIADKKNIKIKNYVKIKDILITHGNKIPKVKNVKTIIIGHEHPAITITDNSRQEKYKCFLKGNYQRKNLIVQPCFCLLTEGTDITKEKLISPFLQKNLSNFEIFIVSDKIYRFGKVKEFYHKI